MAESAQNIVAKHPEHEGLIEERQRILIGLKNVETQLSGIIDKSDPIRIILIKQKSEWVTQLTNINWLLRKGGSNKASIIADIIRDSADPQLRAKIEEEADRRIHGEKPLIISLYSEDDENSLNYFKQLDSQYKKLHKLLRDIKEEIQKSIPSLKGELKTSEFDKRAEVTKVLSKLLQFINLKEKE